MIIQRHFCLFLHKANFTFSSYKAMGDDDPRGLANLDPRGMIGRTYVGYH